MVDAVLRWSLANRLFVLVGAAALIVIGARQVGDMPVDVFPDLTAPSVTVLVEAHGMAPQEVEQHITMPIEATLQGAIGVRRIRSNTSTGLSVIRVEFDWGQDILVARQVVAEKLQQAAAALPPEVGPPIVAPSSSIMGEILFIGLVSDTVSPMDLRSIADWDVRRRLLAIPGVSQVMVLGGGVQQFQVVVRPEDLIAHGITTEEVIEALRAANGSVSAGIIEQGGQELLIHGSGRLENEHDIRLAVVRPHRDHPVLLQDVADIRMGTALRRGDAAVNAQPAVVIGVQKQTDTNTLALTATIEAVLDSIEAGLPDGVVLERQLFRQADFIENGVRNVRIALQHGALLVILIVGVFLLSVRATLITALAIPLSLLTTVIVLHAFGATINTMTLGGMAIAVGALVDDAIIDVENVVRRLRERLSTEGKVAILPIVLDATREIRRSIVFATLIIVLVFLPLFFLDGVEGRLLAPLGIAYVVSLVASLVVALTVTPVLCSILLPTSRLVRLGTEPWLVRVLRAGFDRILSRALDAWPLVLALAAVGVLVATIGALQAGRSFLPPFNEGMLTLSVVSLPGTSLEESNLLGQQVETLLLRHPEVISTTRRTGRAEQDEHAQSLNASEIDVRLQMQNRSESELLTALRRDLASVPGANITIGQPLAHRIDHMISGTRANLAVKIFGPNLDELRQLANAVEERMARIPGVVDLGTEEQTNLPMVSVRVDREAIALHGTTVRHVFDTLEAASGGHVASRIFSGVRSIDIVVRYPDASRNDLEALRTLMIPTAAGSWVPISALASIQRDHGPSHISRESGQRHIIVQCNVGDGRDLGAVVTDIQRILREDLSLPAGYHTEIGGQFEAAEAAARTLLLLGLLVLIGIFLLLHAALRSIRDAVLVMLNLPLALIGGVVGVYLSGGVISVASLIGFITLFGIATRNGIIIVTHIRHLVDVEGVTSPREAICRGASERLSPVLMTALASGLGLLPLALAGHAPGNEIQAPMATVILFGLASSTVLNMLVVPAAMLRFGSVRER